MAVPKKKRLESNQKGVRLAWILGYLPQSHVRRTPFSFFQLYQRCNYGEDGIEDRLEKSLF